MVDGSPSYILVRPLFLRTLGLVRSLRWRLLDEDEHLPCNKKKKKKKDERL